MMVVNPDLPTEKVLKFYYDAEGRPLCLDFNGTIYFYITNLQGDVVALADQYGEVVRYEYDAWGKPISTYYVASPDYDAMQYNPLRYRGYIYDNETGFYYLQSRYYDPVVGRFISSDSYTSTGTGVLGYNMFAYCNNNPVMLIDGNGDFPKLMDFISSTCEDTKELCAIIGIATGVASILFDSENKVLTTVTKICDDVINFDANNEDAEKVLNSKYFSAYKGKLVIRHSFDGTSCGIFETIFLNRVDADDDTVKHEYGHTLQEEQIGTVGYIFKVAIPSLTCYCLSDKYDWFDRNYFNMPWEYNADERGEVSSRTYAWWAKVVSDIYW